jgi:hypothetical protein
VFQPIGGELIVDDGVAGAGGIFEYKKEAQAGADNNRQYWAGENSLHSSFASYNTGDIVPVNGVTLA